MSGRSFADDIRGFLIFTQAKENRLAQPAVARPFRKLHLANEDRFQPVAAFHFRSSDALAPFAAARHRKVRKRTSVRGDLFESGMQAAEQGAVESGAHFAGEQKFSAGVITNNHGAEGMPAAFGVGITSDH